MRMKGLDIEIIRGETASVNFEFKDSAGKPFLLTNSDIFDNLDVVFKVKPNSQSVTSSYLIHKIFNINDFKRFDDETIINLKEYLVAGVGTYDKNTWSGCVLTVAVPPAVWPNQLYYHPDLNQYGYRLNNAWVLYNFEVTVPFDNLDTKDIAYGDYYYDLTIEAYNSGIVEYENILVNQHRFSIVYRV